MRTDIDSARDLHPDARMATFERLIQELEAAGATQYALRLWEIELLLDIKSRSLPTTRRSAPLKRDQKEAKRRMEERAEAPLKLPESMRGRTPPV